MPLIISGTTVTGITADDRNVVTLVATDFPSHITTIHANALKDLPNLKTVALPANVVNVNTSCFMNCPELTSVDMPGVVGVGDSAFQGCSKLTNVNMLAVTYIDKRAFQGCSSLTSLITPVVSAIVDFAFLDCSSLVNVTIPATCGYVGEGAFSNLLTTTSLQNVFVFCQPNSTDGVVSVKAGSFTTNPPRTIAPLIVHVAGDDAAAQLANWQLWNDLTLAVRNSKFGDPHILVQNGTVASNTWANTASTAWAAYSSASSGSVGTASASGYGDPYITTFLA
jgi:hypothetical protein